jgi:hypothetical protein
MNAIIARLFRPASLRRLALRERAYRVIASDRAAR